MAQGLSEEKIERLRTYRDEASFTGRERLALEYAELMALEHTAIGDAFFRRLRAEFTDAEIVELTMAIGQYIGFGRFLHVLEVVRPVCDL
jgi:alkylhydroperoxidase family enzyme